jgi:hypothetical protein
MNSVLVVGTIRNCENVLIKEITRCRRALSSFNKISFYLVESDSNDSTIKILEKIKLTTPRFEFVSLGNLKSKISDQYDRIRFCRNEYVRYLKKNLKKDHHQYVLVIDLDGMNTALKSKSVNSCFIEESWDVVVANQTFGYYDILALRHKDWQIGDWREQYKFYKSNLNNFKLSKFSWLHKFKKYWNLNLAKYLVVYSKMIRIPTSHEWIQVDSGFGGAAFYRSNIFLKSDYTKEFKTIETDHVSLHRKIVRGGKFINPRFINSHYNTYNLNKFFLIRTIRQLIWSSEKIYKSRIYFVLKKLLNR